jgi:hypothetical protein
MAERRQSHFEFEFLTIYGAKAHFSLSNNTKNKDFMLLPIYGKPPLSILIFLG